MSLVKMANQWAEGEDVSKRKDKHQVSFPFLCFGRVFPGNSENNSKKNEIIDGCHR